jgi:hypothetical protein
MNRSTLRYAIIALTLATAGVHLVLAGGAGPMFIVNGLGYIALMVAYLKLVSLPFLAGREKLIFYAYIAYTAVTILGWVAIGTRNTIGYADKIIEILLIAALWQHERSA